MKIKNNSILIFALTLSCAFLFNTCQKDNPDPCAGYPSQTYNYYVSDINKSKIPYSNTGKDTLIYFSNFGDTAILYGQGKQTLMDVFSAPSAANPDCGNISYWSFERILFTFIGNNSELNKLEYGVTYPYVNNGHSAPTPFSESNGLGFIISSTTSTFISCSSFTLYTNDQSYYKDSVNINNLFYKGITLCDSSKLLFNYKYGILRFIDDNQKIWTKKF